MLAGLGAAVGLGVGRVARAFAEAVTRGGVSGPVVVLGLDLGRALQRAGLDVIVVASTPGRRRRKGPPIIAADLAELPAGAGGNDGARAVFASLRSDSDAAALLTAGARVVRDGGLIALASSAAALTHKTVPPEALTAAFVNAALVDVEQRVVGGTRLTLGRVRHAAR